MSELKRQAVMTVLKEMSDNAIPMRELSAKAIEQDWDEDKFKAEMAKAIRQTDMSKTFDYYADRIMSIFQEAK